MADPSTAGIPSAGPPNTPTVTLICGPPCAGKTTYAQTHAKPGDLIVDWDLIAQRLGSPTTHTHRRIYRQRADAEVRRLCDEIKAGLHPTAWVIRSLPDPHQRQQWAASLGARVVLLDEPDHVLTQRARQRPNPSAVIEAIRYWRRTSRNTPPPTHAQPAPTPRHPPPPSPPPRHPDLGRRGPRWRALRLQVGARHEPCCRCGQAINYALTWPDPDAFTVDHYPHALSTHPHLAEDPANLRAAHQRCNQAAGNSSAQPGLGTPSQRW